MSLLSTLRFITSHPLNKDRKAQALLRFLHWQVASRLMPGPVVFEWIRGTRFLVRRGETGMTQNLYCGLHEFDDMAYVLHVLRSDDLFVDAGANAGSYTLLACGVQGARGYCFEPIPSTYRRLLDNLAINSLLDHVTALNIGLSNQDGHLSFTSREDTVNHVLGDGESVEEALTVPVRTLDSVLSTESPTMIKIDVEGYEDPLLRGAEATLNKPSLHSILIELNGSGVRYGFDENRIIGKLGDHGFLPYSYSPLIRELRPLHGKNITSGNTLFLRNEDAIRERIRSAPPIQLLSREF
jgi:FkbM family methyltransferase